MRKNQDANEKNPQTRTGIASTFGSSPYLKKNSPPQAVHRKNRGNLHDNPSTPEKTKKSPAKSIFIEKTNSGKNLFDTLYVQPEVKPSLKTFKRKDSSDNDTSGGETMEQSPQSKIKINFVRSDTNFSMFQQDSQNPSRKVKLDFHRPKTATADDKYFFKMNFVPKGNEDGGLKSSPQKFLPNQRLKSENSSPQLIKKASPGKELVIDMPISSTISVEYIGIKDLLERLVTSTDIYGQPAATIQNLHDFLELIQAMAQFLKANLDTFLLITKSVEEVPTIIKLLEGHPSKESIVQICKWVHLSRCYEENLKQLSRVSNLEGADPLSVKPFDEVRLRYTADFLITFIQDFEQLLTSSKEKIAQEVCAKDNDDILRIIRQVGLICQCISGVLIDGFKIKRSYLITECKELVTGFMHSDQQLQTDYVKIRACIEENLGLFKVMYYKIKKIDKKFDGYFENQWAIKNNMKALTNMRMEFNNKFQDMESVEQNVKTFSGFAEGVEKLKKVISFKLKVENIETHAQMSQIRKELLEYKELLNQYFNKGPDAFFAPAGTQIVEIYEEMGRIPPIKDAFTRFISYFEELLSIQINNEVFNESLKQLKAIDEEADKLYLCVDEQFKTFLKSYFTTLVELVEKSKRSINEELTKVLNYYINHPDIETSIKGINDSVKSGKESLEKAGFLKKYNYKGAIEAEDILVEQEMIQAWNDEVEYAGHLVKYFECISTQVVKPIEKVHTKYEESEDIEFNLQDLLRGYIVFRGQQEFLHIYEITSDAIGKRLYEKSKMSLRDFEGSILSYFLESFMETFYKKSQLKFKKLFANMKRKIDSTVLSDFKHLVLEWVDFMETLYHDKNIRQLEAFCDFSEKRKEDLEDVAYLLEQLLLISTNQPCILTNEDEDRIIPKTAPISAKLSLCRSLLETINDHHGQ